MTLPSRLVSILLVYCFVVASAAPQTRAQTAPRELTVTGNQTHGFFDRTYNFFSTLFAGPLNSPEEDSDEDAGLKFRLSEAPGQPAARTENRIVNAAELSDSA